MLSFERLESRNLCVADPSIIDGVLSIEGGDFADSVTVSREPGDVLKVVRFIGGTPMGKTFTFPLADVNSIDIRGGAGNDTLYVSQNVPLPTYIEGNDGNDFIRGSNQSNMILGGNGNDQIYGGAARDLLFGGAGSDTLYGYGEDDLFVPDIADNTREDLDFVRGIWLSELTFAERSAGVKAVLVVVDAPGNDIGIGSTGQNLFGNPQ